jgi:hypothetical protein
VLDITLMRGDRAQPCDRKAAMNTTKCIARFIAIGACVASLNAGATSIQLSPVLTDTTAGSAFSIAITISGLDGLTPSLALADFDLDISYDTSLLHASSVSFGAGLGSAALSGFDLSAPGIVDLFAVAIADYATLRGLQGDSFTLATLTFLALAPGTDSLALVQNSAFIVGLIDGDNQNPVNGADPANCQTLTCVTVGGASVVIHEGNTVPEPSPLLLLGATALALTTARRAGRFSR